MRFMIALFAMIFLAVSFASALTTSITSVNLHVVQGSSNLTNLTLANAESVNITGVNITSSPSFSGLSFYVNNTNFQILNGSSSMVFISFSSTSSLPIATYNTNIIINYNNGSSQSISLPVTINVVAQSNPNIVNGINATKLCSSFSTGNTNVSISDLEDKSSGTDNDWEWKALDEVKVRVNVANDNDKDNSDYKVQLYFFDSDGKDVSSKFVDETDSLKQDVNNLDNGDDQNVDFAFKLSTQIDSGTYEVVAKVSKRSGSNDDCALTLKGDSQTVYINQDDYYTIVSAVMGSKSVSCGNTLDLTVTVTNTGTEDEDRVKVFMNSYDFKLNAFQEIDNLNSGESKDVTFSIPVPSNAAEKLYGLTFSTQFNYDSSDDKYSDQSASKDNYIYSFNVLGNCVDPTKPVITAKLNSTALVGDNLVIAVSFKNNANTSVSAIIAPEEYDSWAELVSVDPATITTGKAESKTVYITLKPTQAGQQTFNLSVIYNGKSIDQPVTLPVAKKTSLLDGMYGQLGKTGTYLVLGIAVLIILILLVLIAKLIFTRKH